MRKPKRGIPTEFKYPAVLRELLTQLALEEKELEPARLNMKRAEVHFVYQQELYAAAKKAADALAALDPVDFA